MFKEIKPEEKYRYTGITVSDRGIRITKEIRSKLKTEDIGIKVDTDQLEIGVYEKNKGGGHKMNYEGFISIKRTSLQLPQGRYPFRRTEGEMHICGINV